MTSNMYVIDFEDLDWIIEAHRQLGKEDHTWLMVRWLRYHDVSALMGLMQVGLFLRNHKGVLNQVKEYVRKQRSKEQQLTQHKENNRQWERRKKLK